MQTITRRFTFCAAHRLKDHPGRCKQLHGHNYVVKVTASREDGGMGEKGMVLDFADLKKAVGEWLDDHWDHTTILAADDLELLLFLQSQGMSFHTMDGPPTAENMATYLIEKVLPERMPEGVEVIRVDVWETENSVATAE